MKIDFSMKVFVFLISGLLKIDSSVRVFVFLVSGLLKIDFSMRIFVFFGLRPIENGIFNENLSFLASGIVEDGAVPFFHMNLRCF